MVWSQDEEIIPQLSDIQDFTSACKKKSVQEILNKTKKLVSQVINKYIG